MHVKDRLEFNVLSLVVDTSNYYKYFPWKNKFMVTLKFLHKNQGDLDFPHPIPKFKEKSLSILFVFKTIKIPYFVTYPIEYNK
jgi:hypothetical protein